MATVVEKTKFDVLMERTEKYGAPGITDEYGSYIDNDRELFDGITDVQLTQLNQAELGYWKLRESA